MLLTVVASKEVDLPICDSYKPYLGSDSFEFGGYKPPLSVRLVARVAKRIVEKLELYCVTVA